MEGRVRTEAAQFLRHDEETVTHSAVRVWGSDSAAGVEHEGHGQNAPVSGFGVCVPRATKGESAVGGSCVDRSHRQKLGKRQDTGSDGDEDTDTRRQGTAHGPKRHAQWGRSGLRAGLKERSGAGGEESVQTVCSKHRRTHTHSVSARGTGGARWDRQLRGGAVAEGRGGEERRRSGESSFGLRVFAGAGPSGCAAGVMGCGWGGA
eukprot:CAMPEP_0206269732 /NCGR_PEP_ID=MMETSP0047_2-20121206/32466_1 /ASSEMBLY_ACC=CAM_ASM_000192 /TAXON_ID=195065 /ORGANISM="Chroomonas mesostigmatica_cf, Strain CCMP1168" /LENGTH=205 /DNA_ID=CAMNT_0053698275 /DNA_START=1168 /DNA_END=1783 /DNA_ORIENTATION=-